MRVALVKPPATYADWYHRPVLGLSYIAACIEAKGIECRIFDAYFRSWSEPELVSRVVDYQPHLVGLTAMTHEVNAAARIAGLVKTQLGIRTVIGGCHVTALPRRTLAEFDAFDFGVYGEGERTFLELLRVLDADGTKDLERIRGLVFRERENIRVNPAREFLSSEELDALPWPAFHQYYGDDTRVLVGRDDEYVMMSGRGCPFNCAFCMRVLGGRMRRRSAESICREMEYAIERYGVHTFDFEDDTMLIDNQPTREILQSMIDTGLAERVRWSGMIHASSARPELVGLARRAGCFRMAMGVESGDDRILKAIHKNITVEEVKEAVRVVKRAGIRLMAFYILGHPGETRETAERTVNLMAELNADTSAIGLMVPYPGTEIHSLATRGEAGYRLLTEDWAEYDKYGGRVLEIEGLPWEELAKIQRRALLRFFLRNLRLLDLLRYLWKRRAALKFLVGKMFTRARSKPDA